MSVLFSILEWAMPWIFGAVCFYWFNFGALKLRSGQVIVGILMILTGAAIGYLLLPFVADWGSLYLVLLFLSPFAGLVLGLLGLTLIPSG